MVSVGTTGTSPNQFIMAKEDKLFRFEQDEWVLVTQALPQSLLTGAGSVANYLGSVYITSEDCDINVYDGLTYNVLATDFGTALRGRVILTFNNRLVLVKTAENASFFPQRVRWCANGQVTNWDPALTDGAGFLEVVENSSFPLTSGITMNGRCFLTKEREIIELLPTGNSTPAFRHEVRVTGIGTIFPYSWGVAEYFAFFVGPDSVYRWDGSNHQDIGQPIRKTLFEQIGPYSPGSTVRFIGTVCHSTSEYFLTTRPDDLTEGLVFIYDYKRDRWYTDKYPNKVRAICEYRPVFDDETFTSQDVVVFSNDESGEEAGTTFLDSTVTIGDRTFDQLDPVPIFTSFETKDYLAFAFTSEGKRPALDAVNILHRVMLQTKSPGQDFFVEVSTDEGVSWSSVQVTANEFGIIMGDFVLPFQTIRFRIRSAMARFFYVRGVMSYDWKPGGASVRG
jgi:hypothetical protein